MFEFYGNLRQDIILKSHKKLMKDISVIFIGITILLLMLCIIVFFVNKSFFSEITLLSLIFLLVEIFLLFSKPKSIMFKFPRRIIFDLDKNLTSYKIETNYKEKLNRITRITKIYDYGDWYYIKFKFDPSNYLVCQKDLIVKGTIDEFEKIFKDKLIKKY